MIKNGTCPECGAPVGSEPGTDPYKHAISCLNLPPGRPDDLVELAGKQSEERGRRVRALMEMASATE